MAEAILKRLVAERADASRWHIESAGTWASQGSPPVPLAQIAMQSQGLDISLHRSQPVNNELIQKFDLILTMENHHKEGLQNQFKQYYERIFMLSEMIGLVENIPDPVGGDLEDYVATANRLERILSNGLPKIFQLALIPKA